MAKVSKDDGVKFVGMDVGDRFSHYCCLDERRLVAGIGKFATTRVGLQKEFGKVSPRTMILEAGTHSMWIADSSSKHESA